MLRMHCRRLTRLTKAFSKKLEDFKAAVAPNFAYYNSDADGNFTAVLGIPPASDPQNAVKLSIVAAAKKGKA